MSKTYGDVLLDAMYESIHFERLSMVPEEEFDRCARAVLLEFVRQVEEESLLQSYSDIQSEGDANCWHLSAFRKLAAELKEPK